MAEESKYASIKEPIRVGRDESYTKCLFFSFCVAGPKYDGNTEGVVLQHFNFFLDCRSTCKVYEYGREIYLDRVDYTNNWLKHNLFKMTFQKQMKQHSVMGF